MTNPTIEEKIAATKSLLVSGTLIIVVWLALAAASIWLINPLFGWIFLAFSVFSVFIIIRRQLCNSCYYCKSCTKGIAKLSKLFLGSYHIPGIGKGSALGMAVSIYVILTVIPGIALIDSTVQGFSLAKILVLAGLLSLSIYNLIVRAKNGNK
jgi:hypothetical protein